jgi:hypothetical protein
MITKYIVISSVVIALTIYLCGLVMLMSVAPKEPNCNVVLGFGTSGWHPDIPRATIDYCIKQRNNDKQ